MNSRAAIVTIALFSCLVLNAESKVDYAREILPILSGNCFECHGPDEETREADLRLDTPEGAYADLFGAVAVKPGDPDNSELIYRINVKDKDEVMPPPDSKKTLTEEEKQILHYWIAQGGEYDEHWAWTAPQKPSLPKQAKNAIDPFVLERLKKEGLKPSPPASPTTLVRRIYLDLIGLPPSPQEIDSFISSYQKNRTQAVDGLVDAIMAHPGFGEKWARTWLDVARYSDTNGFEKDKPRDQWVYREWVIHAINADMPYDQFITEQLAGDLLPNHTQDQLIASGFMRNGMVNEEGAIVPEQFRIEGIFDRMDTFGKAALGLTLQCAQCHTNKFDPITHDEYFGLFAFFNETHEAKSWIYSDEQLKDIETIKDKISDLEEEIRKQKPDWKQSMTNWVKEQRSNQSEWKVWDTDIQEWDGGLNHPEELEDLSIVTLGHPTVTGYSITEGPSNLSSITGMRLEALKHGDQPFQGPGRSYWGTFAISEIKVFSQKPGVEDWTKIDLKSATADFETPEGKLKPYFHHKSRDPDNKRKIGPAQFLIDEDDKTAWAPDRGPILRHTESVAVIEFQEPLELPKGSRIKVELVQNHGGDGNDRENQQLGRYRFSFTDIPSPTASSFDHAATLAVLKPSDQRTAEDRAALFRAWRTQQSDLEQFNASIAELESTFPEAKTSVLHSTDTLPGQDRVTRLLSRVAWDKPLHEVPRGTPAVLNDLDKENPTRLDLARWLFEEDAPLTARVQVNRVWQVLFGNGLVLTPEDFGTRVPKPEYLEILDALAVDFRDNGWSLKNLIKTILTSKTYQQSSKLTPELQEKDPRNILLARGPRFRAEAEVIRDIALASSGLISQKIGGPSIYPPVPESVLNYNYVKPDYWNEAQDESRYRRSLYMFRKRSMPDPALSSFDAPNGDASCVRRVRSNTPLSALVSLNEPIFVEATQAMALRILQEGGNTTEERVNYGFLLTTGRPARAFETREIINLMDEQAKRLADGWLDTRDIAFIDPDNPPELPPGTTPRDVAAWAIASRVLLNLDETLTKN